MAVGGFGEVRLGVRVRGLGLGSVGRETQTSGLGPGGLPVGQVSPSSSSLPCPLLCHSLPPSHIAFPLFLSESLPSLVLLLLLHYLGQLTSQAMYIAKPPRSSGYITEPLSSSLPSVDNTAMS